MAQNVKAPAGQGEGFGKLSAVGTADISPVQPSSLEIQLRRLQARYGYSPAYASVIAGHAYGVADDRRAR